MQGQSAKAGPPTPVVRKISRCFISTVYMRRSSLMPRNMLTAVSPGPSASSSSRSRMIISGRHSLIGLIFFYLEKRHWLRLYSNCIISRFRIRPTTTATATLLRGISSSTVAINNQRRRDDVFLDRDHGDRYCSEAVGTRAVAGARLHQTSHNAGHVVCWH